jgi:GLPGLI family protein
MKKYLLLYFIASLSLICSSQINSGVINYSVQKKIISSAEDKSNNIGFKEFASAIHENASELKFKLVFNTSSSLFRLVDNLPIDKEDFKTKMAIRLLRGNNTYYTDLKQKVYFENTEILNEKFSIKTNYANWTITKEVKEIDAYVCYKAIYNRPFIDKNGDTRYTEIIAWFCPKLSFSIGPFEAVGLPGLVLEFHSGQYIFFADSITLKEEHTEIEKPKSGKVITQGDLDKILKQKLYEIKN